jgi:hypothetical protein
VNFCAFYVFYFRQVWSFSSVAAIVPVLCRLFPQVMSCISFFDAVIGLFCESRRMTRYEVLPVTVYRGEILELNQRIRHTNPQQINSHANRENSRAVPGFSRIYDQCTAAASPQCRTSGSRRQYRVLHRASFGGLHRYEYFSARTSSLASQIGDDTKRSKQALARYSCVHRSFKQSETSPRLTKKTRAKAPHCLDAQLPSFIILLRATQARWPRNHNLPLPVDHPQPAHTDSNGYRTASDASPEELWAGCPQTGDGRYMEPTLRAEQGRVCISCDGCMDRGNHGMAT